MIPGAVSYETPLIKDIGKSSSINPANENGLKKKKNQHEKIENLTIELTALKFSRSNFTSWTSARGSHSGMSKTASFLICTVGKRIS